MSMTRIKDFQSMWLIFSNARKCQLITSNYGQVQRSLGSYLISSLLSAFPWRAVSGGQLR